MPLPTDPKCAWPPTAWRPFARSIDEAAAWYSGDEAALTGFYGGVGSGSTRAKFWQRRHDDRATDRQRLHVPVAADVVGTGADLLFGEAPTFLIPEAHTESPAAEAVECEAMLDTLVTELELPSLLLEAAELSGSMSGVWLRPTWQTGPDGTGVGLPGLSVLTANQAVPEHAFGQIVAVTFWRLLQRDEGTGRVWRHLERHDATGIEHGLYIGDGDHLGARVTLDRHEATADIDADESGRVRLPAGMEGRTATYVPNVRPNRQHPTLPYGRSDFAGCEPLMDAIDEAWSSWMRDIRLGKARLIVPNEFMDRAGRGKGATFDPDHEVFTPLEMDPNSAEKAGITPVEFEIRTEEHHQTILALFERVVTTAGYSPATFGLSTAGGTMTATEVRANEGRSLRTTGRKAEYWTPRLRRTAETLLMLCRDVYGFDVVPMAPQVSFSDPLGRDVRDVASTLNLIGLAQAASIETRVRMLNPEWDDAQVTAEVDKIHTEQGMGQAPDPTGGLPFGGGA